MSQIARDGKKNPTNDHAMREFTIQLPWLGSATTGFSGFRFVRIDLLDKDVEFDLRAVQAIHRFRDYDYLGTFKCDNERLNKIWSTAAYTVQENMQEYIWDGIKRDRLVWLSGIRPRAQGTRLWQHRLSSAPVAKRHAVLLAVVDYQPIRPLHV